MKQVKRDLEAVRSVFARLFPDAGIRAAACHLLAQYLVEVHRQAPRNWGVTLDGALPVVLNVGGGAKSVDFILGFSEGEVEFVLDWTLPTVQERRLLRSHETREPSSWSGGARGRRFPDRRILHLKPESLPHVAKPLLRTLGDMVRFQVGSMAKGQLNRQFCLCHTPAILDYLRGEWREQGLAQPTWDAPVTDAPTGKGTASPSQEMSSIPFDPDQPPPTFTPGEIADPELSAQKQEQAVLGHHELLRALSGLLQGWKLSYDVVDLWATRGKSRYLFEAKTLTADNELHQVRAGTAQLLEYRHLYSRQSDKVVIVLNRPPSETRLQVLDALGIGVLFQHESGWKASGSAGSLLPR